MEGMWFTRNRQNTCSFGHFWPVGGKSYAAARAGRVRRYSSSQVTSDSVSRSETCRSVLFQIEILCMLLFLNQNNNSQNSPKRMHPKLSLVFRYSPKVSVVFIEKEVFFCFGLGFCPYASEKTIPENAL